MHDAGLVLIWLAAFALVLTCGYAVFNAILGSPEARDARKRNRHNRAGDPWGTFDDEWMKPRQEQPR